MAKKVILRDLNDNKILPITRGELILDSSGMLAFHSNEFLATDSLPGLMSVEDKIKIKNLTGGVDFNNEFVTLATNQTITGIKTFTNLIKFSSEGYPHIAGNGNYLRLSYNDLTARSLLLGKTDLATRYDNVLSLGNTNSRWSNIYTYNINVANSVLVNGKSLGNLAFKGSLNFSEITSKPNTLAGYGITDALKVIVPDAALPREVELDYENINAKTALSVDAIWFNGYFGLTATDNGLFYDGYDILDGWNFSNYALPLSGGTISGVVTFDNYINSKSYISFKNSRVGSGGFADNIINITDGNNSTVGRFGMYGTTGVSYYYIGHYNYDGDNLRVYADKVSFGNNTVLHAGNIKDYALPYKYIESEPTAAGYGLWGNVGAYLSAYFSSNYNLMFRVIGGGALQLKTHAGDVGTDWSTLIHSGNIGSQSVSYASSAGNSDTVDNMHASQFVPKNYNNIAYSDLIAYYTGDTNPGYYRIILPDSVLSIWNMLTIELTVNQSYSNGYAGKILIYCHNNGSNTFPVFKAVCLGTLTSDIKIYGSGGKYIYIGGCSAWGTISIDKILVGDGATTKDQSSIYIDTTASLPTTYQTASMSYNIDSRNIGSLSVNYANSSGYATSAGSISGYTFKNLSTKSSSGWTNNTTDDKIIPTMSFIAYWNGAYSASNSSNLTYCAQGTIIGSNNIGSQSVNYATSAGTANSVAWSNVTGKPSSYYSLPLAASGTRGGIQIGYTDSGANIALKLSSEKGYVTLTKTAVTTALGYTPPSSDTNTWRPLSFNSTSYSGSGVNFTGGTGISLSVGAADSGGQSTVTISPLLPKSGSWFNDGLVKVSTSGVAEIGRYIDFHPTNASTLDYSVRIDSGTSTTARTFTLGTTGGTLAITADNNKTGNTTTTSKIYPVGTTSTSTTAGNYAQTYTNTNFYVNSSGVFWTSDRKFKDCIKSPVKNGMLDDETGLIRKFNWKDTGKSSYGFIAQELLPYVPEAVDYDEELNKYSVNYDVAHSALIAQLIIKVKELEEEILRLKQLIN